MDEVRTRLQARIDQTTFVDTHEHLLSEGTRLAGAAQHRLQPCDDFALLFRHYAADDLLAAGMSAAEQAVFFAAEGEPGAKWRLVEPYFRCARHTGYVQAVMRAVELLFGEREWNASMAERVTTQMRSRVAPGYHAGILDAAGVSVCHVNSLEAPLIGSDADGPRFQQDLSLLPLSTSLDLPFLRAHSGLPLRHLDDWHDALDWTFATYGPRAVAVKSQAAYNRRLDYLPTERSVARAAFARLVDGQALPAAERKLLEDYLMRACLGKAGAVGLPVKLHCGYYAGSSRMPLARVRHNAGDVAVLLAEFPDVRFVLMHIGYPYQGEYIALAKHYPNAWIDLCWAWIIAPAAAVRFVREFLTAVPANKLLTFGGDYGVAEPIVGHAAIARQGLGLALAGLVDDGWLQEDAALDLIDPLMQGNAATLFPSA